MRHYTSVLLAISVLVITNGEHLLGSDPDDRVQQISARENIILARCKSLVPHHAGEYRLTLRGLAKAKDFQALKTLYESDFLFHEWAAEEEVRELPSDQVIDFCRQFSVGSTNWEASVLALQYHPKSYVVNYLKTSAQHLNGRVRFACYKVCLIRGWEDLLSEALDDIDNRFPICTPNNSREYVLGQVARDYVTKILNSHTSFSIAPITVSEKNR